MSGEESRLPGGLRAFRHRDFRLFWTAQLVSLIGTWMQSVAQSWLVLQLTNSPFRLGLVGTLQFTPMLLLSFVAGALADRLPKRRLIIASQIVLFLQSLGLAALIEFGHVQYWHVALLALVYGIANTIDMPTRQAFLVEMVGKSDLMNAIALNSGMFNAARIVGPALAGVLIARWGMAPAFFFNALSFLPVIAVLTAIHAQGLPRAQSGRRLQAEIGEGLGYAARTPRILLTLAMVVVVSAFLFNYNIFVPLLARDVLHQDASGFGLLMTMLGIGALTGAVALALTGRGRPPVAALAVPALLQGVATALLAAVGSVRLAAALLVIMGFCGILFMAGSNSTLQLTVPDELRGRVMSLYTFVFAGVTPFGSLLVGSIAEAFGIRTSLVVSSAAGVLAVLGLLLWWNGRDRGPSLTAPREVEGPA
ncbi:MAG TPA: MFS transporter [Methylomirabilota bacterium]|nr:MFS transporter [Methylomirabilota bacterium]